MENENSTEHMFDIQSYKGEKETVCEGGVDENIVQTDHLTGEEKLITGDLGTDVDGTGETICENYVGLDTVEKQSIDEGQIANDDINTVQFELDVSSKDLLEGVAGSYNELDYGCFWKGCKWSPDGLCILTNSDDNLLRVFNLPPEVQQNGSTSQTDKTMTSVLKMHEGEIIYDYDWYPHMMSYDPSTCCLISTSKDHPVHLWDAYTGHLRCSYLSYNHLDELVAAKSLSFNLDGSKIYCGYSKMLRIFDSSRPGRECEEYPTVVKNSMLNQSGIISCISFTNQVSRMFALGSFAKSVGVYSENDADLICMMPGKLGGITQLQFSKNGFLLYAGARQNENVFCWDLRRPNEVLYSIKRDVTTNQKIQFDIHWSDRYLFTGNTNGLITACDVTSPDSLQLHNFKAHDDAVNGLSLHPYLPLVASTSGQRHFNLDDSSSSENDENSEFIENTLRIWKYHPKHC